MKNPLNYQSSEYDCGPVSLTIQFLYDQPKKANRSVSIDRINRTGTDYYEMGDFPCREALLMFHTHINKQQKP